MASTYTAKQLVLHLMKSKRWDAFHSPYLFHLFTTCCNEKIPVNGAGLLEKQRAAWIQSTDLIKRRDLGAGSKSGQQQQITISGIARHSLSKPFQCRFLARLIQMKKTSNVLELGTSLGLSAAYMAYGSKEAHIHTIEGDPEIAGIAKALFDQHALNNISLHVMSFDEGIATRELLPDRIDILFLDGHHTAAALKSYYNKLRGLLHEESIVIVDDIFWSPDMHEGWKTLIALPEVTQSVDCFHFGLLFYGRNFIDREHHTVRLPLRMLMKS